MKMLTYNQLKDMSRDDLIKFIKTNVDKTEGVDIIPIISLCGGDVIIYTDTFFNIQFNKYNDNVITKNDMMEISETFKILFDIVDEINESPEDKIKHLEKKVKELEREKSKRINPVPMFPLPGSPWEDKKEFPKWPYQPIIWGIDTNE